MAGPWLAPWQFPLSDNSIELREPLNTGQTLKTHIGVSNEPTRPYV